jgi:hypothetical protein
LCFIAGIRGLRRYTRVPRLDRFVSKLEDPGQPFAWLYRGSDILGGLGVLTAALVGRWPGWGRVQLVLGAGIASCGLADLVLVLLFSDNIGTTERVRILLTSGWFLVVGLFLLRQANDVPDERLLSCVKAVGCAVSRRATRLVLRMAVRIGGSRSDLSL